MVAARDEDVSRWTTIDDDDDANRSNCFAMMAMIYDDDDDQISIKYVFMIISHLDHYRIRSCHTLSSSHLLYR